MYFGAYISTARSWAAVANIEPVCSSCWLQQQQHTCTANLPTMNTLTTRLWRCLDCCGNSIYQSIRGTASIEKYAREWCERWNNEKEEDEAEHIFAFWYSISLSKNQFCVQFTAFAGSRAMAVAVSAAAATAAASKNRLRALFLSDQLVSCT